MSDQSSTPQCESCERLEIENEQLRGAVAIWQKLADERKEQVAAQSDRLIALSEREALAADEAWKSGLVAGAARSWVESEKAKADAYEDAARRVEKIAEDYTHEHGSYDDSTNAWELHHRHAEYIEALDAAVEAIRKRKAEKCHVTQVAK